MRRRDWRRHHRLEHLRQLLPVRRDETPAAGRQDAEGLLDAPAAERMRTSPGAPAGARRRLSPSRRAGRHRRRRPRPRSCRRRSAAAGASRPRGRARAAGRGHACRARWRRRRHGDEEEAGGEHVRTGCGRRADSCRRPSHVPLFWGPQRTLAGCRRGRSGARRPAGGGARRGRQRAGGAVPHAPRRKRSPPPAHRLPGRNRQARGTLGDEVEASLHDRPNGGAQPAGGCAKQPRGRSEDGQVNAHPAVRSLG